MKLNAGPELRLEDARKLIRRAVAKAEDLGAAGAFVIVNDGGVPVSASRMDGAGVFGIPISRAKAYVAGSGHETSATFAGRQAGNFKPTNLEDLVISYALNERYQPQHGDDAKRWTDAYGSLPTGNGTGLTEVPAAYRQTNLDAAMSLSDRAIAEATRRQATVAVAVVDRNGDVMQIDRMDGAAPMSPDVAEAVAVTAVNFQAPSERAAQPQFAHLVDAAPFKFLPLAGGLPINDGARVVGAIGIGGSDPEICAAIAAKAIAAR